MSNIAKLKKKAAEFEQKKQYDKALELYQQVLDFSRAGDEERDVPLYNRVGDLHFRLGNSDEAISYYEKAVDLYAEGGFFNNAIALCNKILRYSPNRSIAYYKLGLISAKKGFNSDAKQNFLEYADRMQKVGKLDEAFRALKEFADLCPGQDDVRLMLAEQLARADRKQEALEQLQLLYDTLEAEGRTTEAAAAVARMKGLDPGFTPKKTTTPRQRKKDGLVFLDLGYADELPPDAKPAFPGRGPHPDDPLARQTDKAQPPAGLELTSLSDDEPSPRAAKGPGVQLPDFELVMPAALDESGVGEHNGAFAAPAALPAPDSRKMPESRIEPLDLAPLVDEPVPSSAGDVARSADASDASIPVLHETALNDPLAGLDVISTPEIDEVPSAHAATGSEKEAANQAGEPEDTEYVDLAQWLEQTRTPQSTRMVAHDEEPEDNQQKDFAEMLEKFKIGVARSVEDTDFDSHYDLGIAFREMGLIDEAIGAFQKATRGSGHRLRASESLGECFIEKGQPEIAVTVLEKILDEPGLRDDALIGVFYLLGRAAEEMDNASEASAYYHRVIAVEMGFRDAARRLATLSTAKAAK
jgi:tetratricopeptide (TPR) repeat protein